MNTPNPLKPSSSLGEQTPRGKSNLYITVLAIFLLHFVVIGGALMLGCKRQDADEDLTADAEPMESPFAPLTDTNLPTDYTTAITQPPPPPTQETNPPVLTTTPNPSVATPATQFPTQSSPRIEPYSPGASKEPVVETQPSTPEGGRQYRVQKGDSFYSIAKKFGVSMNAVAQANPGVDPTRLQIDQTLTIPAPSVAASTRPSAPPGTTLYKVQPGDTLSKIAARFKTTVQAIRQANNLRTDRIIAGASLRIPSGTTTDGQSPAPVPSPDPFTPAPDPGSFQQPPLPPPGGQQ